MKKGLSIVINIILFAIIVLLAWQVVKSIQAPIKFNHEQKARETKVVNVSSTSVTPRCFTKMPPATTRTVSIL